MSGDARQERLPFPNEPQAAAERTRDRAAPPPPDAADRAPVPNRATR